MAAPTKSARQLFVEEVRRADPQIDLARAALLVAKEEYPQISVEQYLARLDQMAEEVKGRLGEETAPLMVLQEMLHVVYARHGFRGNQNAYYDPRNSFFNDVLDRRLGVPLTLGLVLLEVGWRLDLPVHAVNFPDQFLVRFRGDVFDLLIDPYDGGRLRFEDQAQELLDRVYGGRVKVQEAFLREATRREILTRLLRALRSVYVNIGDSERARWIGDRLDDLRPDYTADGE
jgi:regulator of sirC expression with transglutaminase-like and TPR domain